MAPFLMAAMAAGSLRKILRGTGFAIDAVGADDRGIDGGAFYDAAFGGQVAVRETDGRGEAAVSSFVGGHDDVVGVDAVAGFEGGAEFGAAFGGFPLIEKLAQGDAADGLRFGFEEAGTAEMEHGFGDASGQEDLNGRMVAGAVGEGVDDAGDLPVDASPIGGGGTLQSSGVGDGGQVQDQVRGASESGVGDHGVVEGFFGQDVFHRDGRSIPFA